MIRRDVHLIPFEVHAVQNQTNEVPEGVKMIGAPHLWDQGYKGEGIVVAVLDTGCQMDHPDLISSVIDGKNFTTDYGGNTGMYADNNGHGTHVAGTIAAVQNGQGVVGVAPAAKLLICKVLRGDGSGTFDSIMKGIDYAVKWRGPNGERVRVISMSLGGPEEVPGLQKLIQNAVSQGISFVVAAGNEGDDKEETFEYAYPAAYNEVIEVGAVDYDSMLAYFSNNNAEIDVVAPGVDIVSTYPGSRYARLSGTSMATPHVSGAIALLIQKAEKEFARGLSEAEIYAQLVKCTETLGFRKSSEGNGLVRFRDASLRELVDFIKKNYCS
ncbi:S8 family peptidase [Fictibacillus sp. NRS-1165]|uniref:S8 family peptidase n=1 Tax=Fictibacillus sp. NRS-1165 TaxID=3144463 RepID=UPI003D1D7200